MKDLIVDYIPFEVTPEQINESISQNNGKLVVHGVLQRANAKNQNGRVYPREILEREGKKYTQEFVNTFEPDFNFNDTPVNRYNISTNNSAKNILIKAEKLAELKKKIIR